MHSRAAVEEFGEDYGLGTNVAGAGPYQVTERDGDTFLRLERFEDWDWPRPHLEEVDTPRAEAIEYQVFSEDATISAAFEAGDIDGILQAVPSNKVGSYNNNPDFGVKAPRKSATFDFTFFNMDPNSSNDPIVAEDLSLRKAISYAIDRESMGKVTYTSRTAEPWSAYASPVVPSAQVDDEFRYNFDLTKARNVMEEGGWNVEPDGTSTKNGREASFELNPWNDTLSRQRAQVIQEMLQEIGVQVDVVPVDFATANERGENGDFTAIMYSAWTWGNANTLWWLNDGSLIDNYFACTRSTVQFPQVQELLDEARAAKTWDQRIERYTELHEFLLDDVVPMVGETALFEADAHTDTVFGWNAGFSEYSAEYIWDENW
jgi:ABC-type transport system substrate-binding protein